MKMQIMVRAFTIDGMLDASKKVNRALKAGALAIGGKVEIDDKIGYLPMNTNRELSALYKENMIEYTGAEKDSFVELYETAGSTDLGDLLDRGNNRRTSLQGLPSCGPGTCLYRSGKDDGAYDH